VLTKDFLDETDFASDCIAEAGIEASGWIELQTTAKKIARIEPKSSQNLPKTSTS
jgi:hypothetical protein